MIITMLAICYISYVVRIIKDGILWICGSYDIYDLLLIVCRKNRKRRDFMDLEFL